MACAILLVGALASCGGATPTDDSSASASVSPSVSASATPSPSASASSSASPTPDASGTPHHAPWTLEASASAPESRGVDYTITAVRVGEHPDFDRVVIDLVGGAASEAMWLAQYDPEPRHQGKGDPIELAAPAYLRVIVRGLENPPPGTLVATGIVEDSQFSNVAGVEVDTFFEGQGVVYIGLDKQREYRVTTLESPSRIVIDIKH